MVMGIVNRFEAELAELGAGARYRIFTSWGGVGPGGFPTTETGWHWRVWRKELWEGSLSEAIEEARKIEISSTHMQGDGTPYRSGVDAKIVLQRSESR